MTEDHNSHLKPAEMPNICVPVLYYRPTHSGSEVLAENTVNVSEFQMTFLRPWRAPQETNSIRGVVPDKREECNPFTKVLSEGQVYGALYVNVLHALIPG